jgi:transcriptional regulator with XRE-family HTH domain
MLCDMDVESRIGASLAVLRRGARLPQAELARLAGTPVSTVRGIELGTIEPPAALVGRLTAAIASRLRDEPG